MKVGDRIHLQNHELRAALASGLVEPSGVDAQGQTVYVVTQTAVILTGRGVRGVGTTAARIAAAQPLLFGRGMVGLS